MVRIIIKDVNVDSKLPIKMEAVKTFIVGFLKENGISCQLVTEEASNQMFFKKVDEDKFFSSLKENYIPLKADSPTRAKLGRNYLKTTRLNPEQSLKLDDCFAFLKDSYGLSFKLMVQEFADDPDSLMDFRGWNINNKTVVSSVEGVI